MGQSTEAAAGFQAAGRLADETGSYFYEAERLRLLARTDCSCEEDSRRLLNQARELAQRQGALVFELRAALDLARLDEDVDTAGRLAAVVDRFPARVGYPELNEARALLDHILSHT
jgi:hypothetical protein